MTNREEIERIATQVSIELRDGTAERRWTNLGLIINSHMIKEWEKETLANVMFDVVRMLDVAHTIGSAKDFLTVALIGLQRIHGQLRNSKFLRESKDFLNCCPRLGCVLKLMENIDANKIFMNDEAVRVVLRGLRQALWSIQGDLKYEESALLCQDSENAA